MDFLGPQVLRIATNLSVLLSVLSIGLLLIVVAVRFRADRRAKRRARFRRRAEPALDAFVKERGKTDEIVPLLRKYPDEALDLLMEISARLEPEDRLQLQPLFACLPLKAGLHKALRNRRWERRLPAAERLGYLGNHDNIDDLVSALKDEVLVVRYAAARSLVALRTAEAVEPILLAFDVPGELNERRTAEIVGSMGSAAVAPLLAVLSNPGGKYSDSVINVASRVLGMLQAGCAATPLAGLLAHPDFRVRLNAARSLGAIGDRTTLPAVAKLADDPSWEVRNVVMQTIGKLRGDGELHRLIKALGDDAWWVRFSAAQALFSLGQPGIEALNQAARGAADRYAREMSRQVLQEHGALTNANAI